MGHTKSAFCAANILYSLAEGSLHEVVKGEAIMFRHRAFDLYRQAADAGHVEAMNSLGLLLESESSFTVNKDSDHDLAAQWYFEAANHGLEEAVLNLCLLIATGKAYELTSVAGRFMSFDALVDWLPSHTAFKKLHLTPKLDYALKRIETLALGDRSKLRHQQLSSYQQEKPAVLPDLCASPFRRTLRFEEIERTESDSRIDRLHPLKPPRPSAPGNLTESSPLLRTEKRSRDFSGLLSPPTVSRSLRHFEESASAHLRTGLKPLSKQYEALATASSYV